MLRKVLVVDDNIVNRQILIRILTGDYAVLSAEDGRAALDILKTEYESISAVLLDLIMPVMDGYEVLEAMRADENYSQIPVIVTTGDIEAGTEMRALTLGANDYIVKPYNPEIIKRRLWNTINLRETAAIVNAIRTDALTGLYSRIAFFEKAEEMIKAKEPGYYVMACFDVDNFKVINDQYGNARGDEVLRMIARIFRDGFEKAGGICCRIMADNFAVLYPASFMETDEIDDIRQRAVVLDGLMLPITFSIGRYIVNDLSLTVSAMYDRATIAESTIKGRYDVHIALYQDSMLDRILREQEITSEMNTAIRTNQFEVWLQPQYNHSNGALIGAEALVRWRHPKKGLISPGVFIPVFERNGFIYELDKYVWRQSCALLRKWQDEKRAPLPLSVNISRYDIFRSDIVDVITGYVEEYGIPVELLRLEITESAFAKSTEQIISVVKRLVDYGFTMEIDDFGSGYSSLNTLKDVPAHVLKLDMRFLEDSGNFTRGGNILESVVRMTKWLGMSVIAEGVETIEQADFLKSVGCHYVQGYLYAKPMTSDEYESLSKVCVKEAKMITLETIGTLDNETFWSPNSIDSLIFNSYVGGASVFEFYNGHIEILRVNEKYAKALGGERMTIEEALNVSWEKCADEADMKSTFEVMMGAIQTGDEVTDEMKLVGMRGEGSVVYLRSHMRVIAHAGERYLFYCMVEDITAQRSAEKNENDTAEQMRIIMENVGSGITAVAIEGEKARYLFANDKYYDMIGYTRSQYAEEITNPFAIIHPDDREWVAKMVAELNKTGKTVSLEYRVIRRDGREIWLNNIISISRVIDKDNPVQLSIFTDITQSKLSEDKLRFLNDTARDLLAQADAEQGIESVLQKALDYFGASRAFIYEYNYDENTCSNTYEVCAPGMVSYKDKYTSFPLGTAWYWLEIFKETNFFSMYDVNELGDDRKAEREVYKTLDVKSVLAVSLREGGRVIGTIGVFNPTRHLSGLENLDAVGDYMAVILERRDMNAKLRNSAETLSNLMGSIPGGIAMYEVSPERVKALYLSDGVYSLIGYSKEEYLTPDLNPLDIVLDDDVPALKAQIERLLLDGSPIDCTYRINTAKGERRWINLRGSPSDRDNDRVFVNAVLFDVTEAKTAELELEASHHAMEIASTGARISLWMYDIDNQRITRDFGIKSMLGYSHMIDDVPYSLIKAGMVHKDDVAAFEKMYRDISDGAQRSECTVRMLNLNTRRYEWQHTIYSRMQDQDGTSRNAIGFSTNVDIEQENRQRYEHELQLRRELIKNSIFYYQLNLTRGIVEEYHSQYKDTPSMKADAEISDEIRADLLKNVAPEDAERVRDTIFAAALIKAYNRGENTVSLEYRRRLPGEGLRWVRAVATIMERPSSGDVIAFLHSENIDTKKKDQFAIETIMEEEIESVAVLNVKTGKAHFVQIKAGSGGIGMHQEFDFESRIDEMIRTRVYEKDQSACEAFFRVEKLKESLEKEPIIKLTYRVKDSEGRIFRKKSRAFYLDCTKEEIVLINRDITDLYEEEQRHKQILQKAVDTANAASRAKSEFLSRMSHDMRTPLNAVLTFSNDLLTSEASAEQLRDYLKKIHASGDYLLGIINDVLDMSRIEQKKIVLNNAPYPMTEFTETINTVIGEMCRNKGVEFAFDAEKSEIPGFVVDKVRFNQIFINLLSNAVKFTPKGGRIEFIIERDANNKKAAQKRFIVRDNGIGMSREFLPHAFESFSQESSGQMDISEKSRGTGLGLAIVNEIVKLMNGTINVESELGKGTAFTVILPIETAVISHDAQVSALSGTKSLAGLHILLCEDNTVNTEIAVKLLEKQGCIVECAANGREGLEKFKASAEGYYNAILMDIRMPVMDGLEASKLIRESERSDSGTVLIIAMTADVINEDEQSSSDAGMNAHLSKPIEPAALFNALRRALP